MLKVSKNNSFKIFILKLVFFISLVYSLDLAIGTILKRSYFRQKSGYDFLTTYSTEQTKADILIFGSSRAVNIYDPGLFQKETQLSCFNVGRYGESIFYHYAILKCVLKRYTPKIIILSFDAGNFSLTEEAYDRLSVLLPYYQGHPELRSIVDLKSPYEKLKLLSNIYPYNSLLLPIIWGNTSLDERIISQNNGFIPLKKTISGPLRTVNYATERKLDANKIKAYKGFIQDCISSHIKLYIVCPPYLINSIGTDLSLLEGKSIAMDCHVDFLDYSRDSTLTKKTELFADFRHLNEKGAGLFSNKVIENITQR